MNFFALMFEELKAIVTDKAIAITLFGGVIFYSVLYPLPYLNEVPTRQQIVVVDGDHSSLSRLVIRHAQASPKLEVVAQLDDLTQAQAAVNSGQAHGYLVIPEGFRRDLLRQRGVTLAYGGDANYFLVYSAILEGLVSVGIDAGKYIQFQGLLARGEAAKQVQRELEPIKLNSVPAFNPSLGYTSYVVPGVLLLVLHQTLLIGTGILGAGQWRRQGYWHSVGLGQLLSARVATFGLIYSLFTAYYIGYCHYWYQVGVQGNLGLVCLFLLPFLLATSLAGIAFSSLFVRRDLPTQVLLLISMPILFVSGFVWPVELIPAPLQAVSQLIPGVVTIKGMLQLNQMGADWQSVAPLWWQLWGLVLFYLLLAYLGLRLRLETRKSPH
ncbi:ABC transporter permease [Shewanella alkalitolerans]|uniref:ABC transporter permease n=1 Tax=Shewanella alkalitolerans TaxID=2864209 RepID=UPI001C65EEF7|nr:ABC transporter permease [Shewanella alkalitolerans]QYJ98071.1 ABC transporter permease [Shewanella alkalitolerans]